MNPKTIKTLNPRTGDFLDQDYVLSTPNDLNEKVLDAQLAFMVYRNTSGNERAVLLETIAEEIEAVKEEILGIATLETGLPAGRIQGETGRTVGQLRLFAEVAQKEFWVDAAIDTALPDRQPLPKSDIRKCLVPLGPVAVFGASNFPLAFSTAGGDTAAALASGNPVIVKAHNSHLGTHQCIAAAIARALERCNLPKGIFSSVIDEGYLLGAALVQHSGIKAVGFTGSYNGGIALLELVSKRKEPIPFYGEMGSVNPIVLFPSALRDPKTVSNLIGSINLGVGQFCTNPGLILTIDSEATQAFCLNMTGGIEQSVGEVMLNKAIYDTYEASMAEISSESAYTLLGQGTKAQGALAVQPSLALTSGKKFLAHPKMAQEIFGPYSLIVSCENHEELAEILMQIEGQLTLSFMGEESEFEEQAHLVALAQEKAGRIIFNGVPTGVEVGHAMIHGGPFPATTAPNSTSVGADAVKRFARPICFQDAPQSLLPMSLQDENPLEIYRKINGEWSQDKI
jgi:alpha-ketoglutaric semialdehyde dehydrogenase|tara:strand:+ start:458 stop:1993 length:1536 start_codon:yes stop_codon:yes gene_type:complete